MRDTEPGAACDGRALQQQLKLSGRPGCAGAVNLPSHAKQSPTVGVMSSTPVRWSAAVLLALYSFVIARLTLAPASAERGTFDLLERVMTTVSGGALDWNQIETIANVALFVPAGFLLAVVLRRCWASAVLCALGSAAIELAQHQLLPSRVASVADVLHNALGGIIGAALAWPLANWVRTRRS